MGSKLRDLLMQYLSGKANDRWSLRAARELNKVSSPKAERLSWLRTRTDRPAGSLARTPTKRESRRAARKKKVQLLCKAYGQR
jgi:hypothetical protein